MPGRLAHLLLLGKKLIRPLSKLGFEEKGIVAFMRGDAKDVSTLKDLGIHIGAEVKVLHGGQGNSILVAVADTRIGINFDLAKKILVN